jgi:hypothetical protein
MEKGRRRWERQRRECGGGGESAEVVGGFLLPWLGRGREREQSATRTGPAGKC